MSRVSLAERPGPLPAAVSLAGPAALARLEIDPGLGAFFGYGARRQQVVREALDGVLRAPGGEIIAAVDGNTLIGYLLVAPADADMPWGRLRDPRILDVAIEVSRAHRGRGIAHGLFRSLFARPIVESRIYVATGYAWCWDLTGTGAPAPRYAARLLGLFQRHGFEPAGTDELTIVTHPHNWLAVRIGRLAPPDLVKRFRTSLRRRAA